MIEIRTYQDAHGRYPFDEWLSGVRDERAAARVKVRLARLKQGNEGDRKSVGDGVMELRIREGKGYRVYYTWDGNAVVLLLVGGNKSTQAKDIALAKVYRRDYYA